MFYTFDLKYNLILALVERWRLKTHTFHLSCGECTIILEDVALQLRLPIDDSLVTGLGLSSTSYIILRALLDDKVSCCGHSYIASFIPSSAHIHAHLWRINAPLPNFSTVEWYNRD
ncbi:hypothetical protein J1N35_004977 [Gossypium stocksii]|uniref:Aminotransferase-like plant mobile domain-containing protein n=1 Tax=Gossypium stocksii TaxID=47602 RepID=A0A9D4AGL8_9ROSI|nr:hypothetical protein J1N35_004977 [Gossypium stocksii]